MKSSHKIENGHSGVEVGVSETRFSSTMTLCCTTVCKCRTAQLKKNDELSYQVPRCWPHPTVRRSPGHIVFGRPGLMVTLSTHLV